MTAEFGRRDERRAHGSRGRTGARGAAGPGGRRAPGGRAAAERPRAASEGLRAAERTAAAAAREQQSLEQRALEPEQLFLDVQAAGVADELARRADHAVAG